MIPDGHPLLERVVADSAVDLAAWHRARPTRIGASNAAGFAKLSSVESYVRAAVLAMNKPFQGNGYTAAGHLYEPGIMAWAGVTHNTRMFHSVENEQYSATPDGVDVLATGVIQLGEAKVKHKIVTGPTPAERRQMVWAQMVAGAPTVDVFTKFAWLHVNPDTGRPHGAPQLLRIDFDPDLLGPLLEIAAPVLAAMNAAAAFQRENTPR